MQPQMLLLLVGTIARDTYSLLQIISYYARCVGSVLSRNEAISRVVAEGPTHSAAPPGSRSAHRLPKRA